MLAVISDLHFEEEATDVIRDPAGQKEPIIFQRNIPSRAFARFFSSLGDLVKRNRAEVLDFVLAGDIFDLHRTSLWFSEDPKEFRPFVDFAEVESNPTYESKILKILKAIADEKPVAETLGLIQLLARKRYLEDPLKPGSETDFPVDVRVHYLPGNHDRLANASGPIRSQVRSLLGLTASAEPFSHTVPLSDPRVFVRHGHEYDRFNFSEDYEKFTPFPAVIPDANYAAPSFGDFITVEVASRLPYQFRSHYAASDIVSSPALRELYLRLLEFDDVRPQSDLLAFLLSSPDSADSEDQLWGLLKPVLQEVLKDIYAHDFLQTWLHKLGYGWVSLALKTKFWDGDVGLDLIRDFGKKLVGSGSGPAPEAVASREELIRNGTARFVIAGHTHEPQVAGINATPPLDRFYVDTGTWRRRILAAGDPPAFASVKALTYVTVCGSKEDPRETDGPTTKTESFDYWSGYTERWA